MHTAITAMTLLLAGDIGGTNTSLRWVGSPAQQALYEARYPSQEFPDLVPVVVFPTEGGHTDFAPRNELEFQLLQYLRDKYQISRVSVERVVSGQGIVAIYQFLRDRLDKSESPEIAHTIKTWEHETGRKEKSVDAAAAISQAALAKSDPLCEEAMEIFVDAYGAEAGNFALKLLPFGGMYIAGGIAAKNLPLIQQESRFMRAFTQKGRVSLLVERVPVRLVLNPQVGLIGAAICAARL
ncbi:glucokinase [Kamptonema formosum]|uniref:glucokinase n=1 Tax=Kamptonema formosum TaxID=331992 RepID=UPI00350EAF92